ncbi:glycosyltransferase family 4 protein [Thauera sp. SWB20]|uniref:glycosyltransferase family 4 protein n=1 Tax=Thauera sp. SWB20 TaxID=1572758 RepID=UPI0005C14EF8|nr:glycosyltransferase family 4 protein [Thauera sp. SWB20]
MKNVWILNHYAQEPGGAGGTRHYSLARHLLKHGWQSSVIAASVELNTGRQRLADGERTRISDFDGIPFLWVRTPQYEGNGGGRMGNMLTYAARVLLPGVTKGLERPDVIVGSSVHPFAAWSGSVLARRLRVPFVFEVRDLWPQTLVDLGRLQEQNLITKVLRKLEKWLYVRADRIVVLLPQADEYIVPLGVPKRKIVWIPNGVELEGYPEPTQPLIHDGFTLMYFGAHGQANGLDCVLRAMAELQERPDMRHVRLRMIGDGPLKPSLLKLAEELQLRNVEFADPVPKREIPAVAAEADAFVFNLIDAPVFQYGISSNKLFDFLAGARPIIFCCKSSNNPVADAHAGITVLPGDPLALSQAIATLATMPAGDRNEMGRAGRAYVERNHSFDSLAARFAAMLKELVAEYR